MKADDELDMVSFVTLQDGDDLIVSFAIADEEPGEIISLILLRTPKYEALLPVDERGVSVSHESFPEDDDRDRLRRLTNDWIGGHNRDDAYAIRPRRF